MKNSKFDKYLQTLNIYDVVILNLKTRPDRLSFMKFKLDTVNIKNYNVFEATNGYSAENKHFYKRYVSLNKDQPKMIQSPGAMGCALSYRKMFKMYLDDPRFTENDKLFIMEDDINFHKNFNQEVLNREELIQTSDIVYLGANQPKWLPFEPKTYYKVFTKKWHQVYGTYGFIINRKAIKLIYEQLDSEPSHYKKTIDVLMWLIIVKYNLNANVMFPNLLIADVTDSDNMGRRDMAEFAKQRKLDLSLYNYIHDNTIFYKFYNNIYNLRIYINDPKLTSVQNFNPYIIDDNLEFVFIVPSYNNEEWVEKNLESIMTQKHPFWRVIYINDASTDKTHDKYHDIVNNSKFKNRFIYIKNKQNMKQAYSRYIGYNHVSCKKSEIAVLLDGDDWLYNDTVLEHLNNMYKGNALNMSWGQFYYHGKHNNALSGTGTFPVDISLYREYPRMICQHLRTMKINILQQIPQSYLQDKYGNWYECCTDVAENMCALELSNKKYMNVGKPLVVYNTINSVKYPSSYYNTSKYNEHNEVRDMIMKKIKNEKPLV